MIGPKLHRRSVLRGLLVATLAALASGCSRSGADRAVVSGKVSFQGQPVASGQIIFQPAATTQAASSGAQIIDGEYVADAKGGVPAGTFHVRIYAHRFVSGKPATPEDLVGDIGGPPQQQYIPARYNERSELTLIVERGQTRISRDFELP